MEERDQPKGILQEGAGVRTQGRVAPMPPLLRVNEAARKDASSIRDRLTLLLWVTFGKSPVRESRTLGAEWLSYSTISIFKGLN